MVTTPTTEAGPTALRTGDANADPVALAAEALAATVRDAAINPEGVELVVVACADPGQWPGALHTPLLDGKFSADVVRRLLLGNGLTNAVPFGVYLDPTRVAELAQECAGALASTEGLHAALAVAVWMEEDEDGHRLSARAWPVGDCIEPSS